MDFDIVFWEMWRRLLHFSILGLGILSTLFAFFGFKSRPNASTVIPAILIALITLILLGFYPIEWGLETDRENYARIFFNVQEYGLSLEEYQKEFGFLLLTRVLGKFLNVEGYFCVIALIYILNYFLTCRRLAGENMVWLLIAVILSMGFISYNINTMRGGLALSFIILAIAQYPSLIRMGLCLAIGVSLHTSAIIPAFLILVSYFYDRTKLFYILWFASVLLSFVAGNTFNTMFESMGGDDRTYYLVQETEAYESGFRLNFIIYSLAPLIVGAYYIFRRNFQSRIYRMIYNSYVLTNIFWVLVIRAAFSDRFAYLSWCMIPIVLMYPLLKKNPPVENPRAWIATILISETAFLLIV